MYKQPQPQEPLPQATQQAVNHPQPKQHKQHNKTRMQVQVLNQLQEVKDLNQQALLLLQIRIATFASHQLTTLITFMLDRQWEALEMTILQEASKLRISSS